MRTKQADLDRAQRIRSWARDPQPIRGVSDLSDDTACKGVWALAPPGSQKKSDKKKSPLWVYISPSISQTNNKQWASLENKWEIYFYKEVFRSFIEFCKSCMRVYIYIYISNIVFIYISSIRQELKSHIVTNSFTILWSSGNITFWRITRGWYMISTKHKMELDLHYRRAEVIEQ